MAVDHRGHGRSEKLGATERYSIDRLATDLIALIESAADGPVDLLGHSMGGAISLRLTLQRPDLVRSLILMDTSGWSFVPADPNVAALMTAFIAGYDPAGGLPNLGTFDGNHDEVRARLGEIGCPVTVIVGEHDHPFIDQAAELAGSVADGWLTVIPGAYHSPQLTHPAEWTAAVETHLARVS